VNYLPVDHEAEDWEFAERLIPALIIAIQSGLSTMKIDELGINVIDLWRYFAPTYKKQMVARLEHIIKLAAQKRFAQFISYGEKGRSKNELRIHVADSFRSKPGILRARLSKQSRAFLEDLQSPQIAIVYDN
jgi:hypothetical protein